jgi:hypothetical protein
MHACGPELSFMLFHSTSKVHLVLYDMQAPRPKRNWTRRKDPAEVSANYKAANNRLVEYGGEMIPKTEKARRIRGEQGQSMPAALTASATWGQELLYHTHRVIQLWPRLDAAELLTVKTLKPNTWVCDVLTPTPKLYASTLNTCTA